MVDNIFGSVEIANKIVYNRRYKVIPGCTRCISDIIAISKNFDFPLSEKCLSALSLIRNMAGNRKMR